MIRINLAPPSALKNKFWYVPEFVIAVVFYMSAVTIKDGYLGSLQENFDRIKAETDEIVSNTDKMKPDVEKFAMLTRQINALNEKLKSLESITVSKTGRFLPIIILEYMQNLKPEGLWLNGFSQDNSNKQISINGGAFDNLLIAEFMSDLEATKHNKFSSSDIRSTVFFPIVHLNKVSTEGAQSDGATDLGLTKEQQDSKATLEKQSLLKDVKRAASSANIFSELNKFPTFSLVIKYDDRLSAFSESENEKEKSKTPEVKKDKL